MIKNGITIMDGQEAFDAVTDLILGKDYYIEDPLTNIQANPIILEDIKSKYNKLVTNLKTSSVILAIHRILFIALLICALYMDVI